MNISYEGFYVQEAQKIIEEKLAEKYENLGMNEMMSNIIKTVVEEKKKKDKLFKKKRKVLQIKFENENLDNNKIKKKKSLSKALTLRKSYNYNISTLLNKDNNIPKNQKSILQNYLEAQTTILLTLCITQIKKMEIESNKIQKNSVL